MELIILPANQPAERFYRGGARIAAFRGTKNTGERVPEDWIASTTSVRNHWPAGVTTMADGRLLADAIAEDPIWWLGHDHVAAFGTDTRLLVKLLDAGQRLPVHAHPSTAFAAEHLHTAHGKAEAWYILAPGTVYLGLREPIERHDLEALVDNQSVEQLLSLMHTILVQAGDTVFVPPGLLHAIGEGILLVEVQEPEDLSILLEWRDFAIDGSFEGHLGLGFDTALKAIETRRRTPEEIEDLLTHDVRVGPTLADGTARYFRLERIEGPATINGGFAVLIVTDGALVVGETPLDAGSTAVLPHASGKVDVHGDGVMLVARPPQATPQ